jgi:hypothetical protein
LEVWDIAKQNMDPIFRLDINGTPKDSLHTALETIEESEENGLDQLKNNTKLGKGNSVQNGFMRKNKRSVKESSHFTSLLFSSKYPVLLAGDTHGKVQVFRVWGYEQFFDKDCDQETILMRGIFLTISSISIFKQTVNLQTY